MPTSDRRPSRQPLDPPQRGIALAERPSRPGPDASYYDPDASSFDDVHEPTLAEIVVQTAPAIPSADLLGVSPT